MLKLEEGEHYWVLAPAVDPENPLMIGWRSQGLQGWFIDNAFYVDGPGVYAVAHIERPNPSAVFNAQLDRQLWVDELAEKRRSICR
jgi:hypothetical protein